MTISELQALDNSSRLAPKRYLFLAVRDRVNELLSNAGAARMGSIIDGLTGDSWFKVACVERLVDLGEIKEVSTNGAGQHRIFTR
jgi:hypothetical protein